MTLLICYKNYYGAHVFFLRGAQSMLKPALTYTYYIYILQMIDFHLIKQLYHAQLFCEIR